MAKSVRYVKSRLSILHGGVLLIASTRSRRTAWVYCQKSGAQTLLVFEKMIKTLLLCGKIAALTFNTPYQRLNFRWSLSNVSGFVKVALKGAYVVIF